MKTNTNIAMMALSAGTTVVENPTGYPVYTGVFAVKVIAVNPTKKELETIYGRDFKEEPVYQTVDSISGVSRTTVSFIIRTIPEKCDGVDTIFQPIRFFINDAFRYTNSKEKVQICNPYGDFIWVTKEDFAKGEKPTEMTFLMEDVRKAYQGEERLTQFLRAALNIPRVQNMSTGNIIEDKLIAVCRLDSIEKLAKTGDVTEIRKAIPATKVLKLGAGVRTTDDNRTFQDWFLDYPMKGGTSDYKWYDRRVRDTKDQGMYAQTVFGAMPYPIALYSPTPSIITPSVATKLVEEDEW